MFNQSLIFRGALHLSFVVSERASEIPSCYCCEEAVPTFGIMSLVVLGVVRHVGGVAAMAAFIGGCAMELGAVCRPTVVRGAATIMADLGATHGESGHGGGTQLRPR